MNPYVATFYDAVLLYAYGLNRTLESGQNFSDGFTVGRKMWNVSFEGLKKKKHFLRNNSSMRDSLII